MGFYINELSDDEEIMVEEIVNYYKEIIYDELFDIIKDKLLTSGIAIDEIKEGEAAHYGLRQFVLHYWKGADNHERNERESKQK